jgi:hypothetical protein
MWPNRCVVRDERCRIPYGVAIATGGIITCNSVGRPLTFANLP